MALDKKLLDLVTRKEKARLAGGEKRIASQHEKGKYTARERIEKILDAGSFEEFDMFVTHRCNDFDMQKNQPLTDGVITGYGTIQGRLVFVFSQDFTIFGGSLSKAYAEKIVKVMEMAAKVGAPLIGINDSGGARIQEGVDSLAGYADIFLRNVLYSGVVPQISLILGPCAGGAVYSPAITDFIMMVEKTSYMFLTGPKVVKQVTQEDVTTEQLGGTGVHASKSGVAHLVYANEDACFEGLRKLFSFLPQNNTANAAAPGTAAIPLDRLEAKLNDVVPDNPNKPYDMKEIITLVVDDRDFFETQPLFAANIITGFARLNGKAVGIVANQPKVMAGVLDNAASIKAARFVRFCDAFNIPLVVFEDVPGFMPGTNQEYNGIIRNGAKLLYRLRRGHGAQDHRHRAQGLRRRLLRHELQAHPRRRQPGLAQRRDRGHGPRRRGGDHLQRRAEKGRGDAGAKKEELKDLYRDLFANPYSAARKGYIDDVIEPAGTRLRLIKALEMLAAKRDGNPPKKHGNIPL